MARLNNCGTNDVRQRKIGLLSQQWKAVISNNCHLYQGLLQQYDHHDPQHDYHNCPNYQHHHVWSSSSLVQSMIGNIEKRDRAVKYLSASGFEDCRSLRRASVSKESVLLFLKALFFLFSVCQQIITALLFF